MLKNIPEIISPELLKVLAEMGHGDEIAITDGNFPAQSMGKRVIRADSIGCKRLVEAIMKFFPLDTHYYVDGNVIFMEIEKGYAIPEIWNDYTKILDQVEHNKVKVLHLERFTFFERCKSAYAIVATGETALFANIILKKGTIVL